MTQPQNTLVTITSLDPFTYDPNPPNGFDLYSSDPNTGRSWSDKIILSLGPNIPQGATITALTIWGDNGSGNKQEPALTPSWQGPPPGSNVTIYHNNEAIYEIEGDDNGTVSIKDEESPESDDKYHFGATVTANGQPYSGDPVMINKPG